MAVPRREELVVVVDLHGLFMKVTLTVLEPADHPLVHCLTSFEWSSVRALADKEAELVLSAVEPKPAARFFVDQPRSGRREIVAFGSEDEPRSGRGQLDIIGHVEPARKKIGRAHFRIRIGACK